MSEHSINSQAHTRALIQPLPVAPRSVTLVPTNNWGWLPMLSLIGAFGLLIMAVADAGSRAGAEWSGPLFWVSLALLIVPITLRLATVEASRQERIGLVSLLALSLYLVKILYSPMAFTLGDEFFHAYNTQETLRTLTLFNRNPLLQASPLYPGLQSVTAGLTSLSGLSVFEAGIVVVGAARFVLVLALFLFSERLSRSPRVAGIAAVLYMANPNFVFFDAQFAYESLALPLAVFVIYCVIRRQAEAHGAFYLGLTLIALLGLMAVVVTHHLTSYALTVFLWVASISCTLPVFDKNSHRAPWGLALVALVAALFWSLYIATITIGYLAPVFRTALESILRTIATEGGRELFQSSQGVVAPLWERATGILSVLLIVLGLPFGMRQLWRQHRHPFALVLAGAALAYPAMLLLRFAPAAWETSNRSSAFLFVGVSFVLALAIEAWKPERGGFRGHLVITIYVAIIFAGGLIAGWKPDGRLAKPYWVATYADPVEPQGVSAARWMLTTLGPGHRIAADQSNARLMLLDGNQYPHSSDIYDLGQLFSARQIGSYERQTLRLIEIEYVVVDRRRISWDNLLGYYFDRIPDKAGSQTYLLDSQAYTKFDTQPNVSRILDTGNITVYDVMELRNGPSAKP
jgi:hypothetical protein